MEHLRTIAGNIHATRGDFDIELPETLTVEIGAFCIGVVHGHQVRCRPLLMGAIELLLY